MVVSVPFPNPHVAAGGEAGNNWDSANFNLAIGITFGETAPRSVPRPHTSLVTRLWAKLIICAGISARQSDHSFSDSLTARMLLCLLYEFEPPTE